MRTAVLSVALLVVVLLAAVPAAPVHAAGGSPQEPGPLDPLAVDPADPELGAATATATDASNSSAADAATPSIVGLTPNPLADEDAGESVVVNFPGPTNASGWTVVDDEGAVAEFPGKTLHGRVVLSTEPAAVSAASTASVQRLDGELRLANGGDAIELRRPGGTVVSEVSYQSAPEGERYRWHGGEWEWNVPGSTSLDPAETTPASATAFVLPDAPQVVETTLRDAERRIFLGGYTLTSDRVVGALVDAQQRDVDVRVVLEGSPVGGMSQQQVDALDALSSAGVSVTVFAGERDPFGVHHAKYAVVDDSALVLTENFKPAGTGGHSSRGWGVVVEGPQTASELAALFHADRTGPGTIDWAEYGATVDPVPGGSSTETYPTHFAPKSVPVDRTKLLVAPDNARSEVESLLRSANHSIEIQQMAIEGIDDSLLQASIAAARNGTEVDVLLSSASYARAENSALVEEIDRLAAEENLPIDAKLVEPRGRFSKVHAKVAIVDDRHVILGSLNWNPAAYNENREVVLVLTGEEVAAYYADVFEADARDEPLWPIPTGLVAAVCVLWIVLALLAIARIRWAT
ncbi:phospholipase D-like domain-containing protein [Salinarchaeum chitinilyticum]